MRDCDGVHNSILAIHPGGQCRMDIVELSERANQLSGRRRNDGWSNRRVVVGWQRVKMESVGGILDTILRHHSDLCPETRQVLLHPMDIPDGCCGILLRNDGRYIRNR